MTPPSDVVLTPERPGGIAPPVGATLEVRGLSVAFGGLVAVDDLTFAVASGELFGLIGPNGAGKTTLLNAVSGLAPIRAGQILLDDVRTERLRPDRVTKLGVARTFQAAEVFNDFRVTDYLLLGRFLHQPDSIMRAALRMPTARRVDRADEARALAMLADHDVAHIARDVLKELPYGMRKLVDLLRALMGDPRLLLLDEPTSGTALEDREVLSTALRAASGAGVTIVLVDHDVQFVSDLCDRVLVMNFGQKLGAGSPAEVLERPDVRAAYVGLEA
jgi:ABC-type branched-subunit amino acid transport system ATPase component